MQDMIVSPPYSQDWQNGHCALASVEYNWCCCMINITLSHWRYVAIQKFLVVKLSLGPINQIDSDIWLMEWIFRYQKWIMCYSMVFRSAWLAIVPHLASNWFKWMENSYLNHFCSLEVMQYISISCVVVTHSLSAKLQVVASVLASEMHIWICSHLSAVMFAAP